MSSVVTKSAPSTKVLIRPQRGMVGLNFRELWSFRELIVFLTWRDILVRYKQTLLGGAWAILQPLLQMLLLNLLFGEVAGLPTGGVPRPLFTFAALLPWNLFSNAVSDASRSLVANRNMITKVYFPRIIVPLANVLSGVLDFAVAFLILAGMMIYYKFAPANLLLLPVYVLITLLTALGVGLWLAALNVHYRDVKYIIPFLTQFWMLASPIAYEASSIFERVPEQWQWLYALNPLVGVVEGFRQALLGIPVYSENMLWVSLASASVMLVSGLMYFRSMERTFADVV